MGKMNEFFANRAVFSAECGVDKSDGVCYHRCNSIVKGDDEDGGGRVPFREPVHGANRQGAFGSPSLPSRRSESRAGRCSARGVDTSRDCCVKAQGLADPVERRPRERPQFEWYRGWQA